MWGRAISIVRAAVRAEVVALASILALVFVVYLPTLDDYFHGDDFLAFIDLTTKQPWDGLRDVFLFQDSNVYWRPLGHLYYLAIYELAGLDAFYFHLANVIVFLLTLVVLYKFCLNFGLGRYVALGAIAVFGLLPNHVISVAWTTNAPRLLATLFALLCLVLLQQRLKSGRVLWELPAFLVMGLAILCDEVAVPLTAVPVLYMWLAQPGTKPWSLQHIARGLAYGAMGVSAGMLQMMVGTSEENPAPTVIGLAELKLGWHIPRELWALVSKLVLPLQDGVSLGEIGVAQWVAGAVAIAAGVIALAIGTRRVKLLVVWILLALAPFTLWTLPIAPARYVYMAAVPFSVLVAWGTVSAVTFLLQGRPEKPRPPRQRLIPAGLGMAAVLVTLALSAFGTIDRNDAFARTAEPYRALADDLPRALPVVPSNTRFVIYYGVWDGFLAWQDAVVQTVYRDRTLRIVNLDRSATESDMTTTRPNDIEVYYTERGFILPAPKTTPLVTSNR